MVRTTHCEVYHYELDPQKWPRYATTQNEELIGKANKTIGKYFETKNSLNLIPATDDDTLVFEDGGFTAGIEHHYFNREFTKKETQVEVYFRITGVPHGRDSKVVQVALKEFVYIQTKTKPIYESIADGIDELKDYIKDRLGIILHVYETYVHDVNCKGDYTDEYNSAWEAYLNK